MSEIVAGIRIPDSKLALHANGIDESVAGVVWDAIALHTTPESVAQAAGDRSRHRRGRGGLWR